MLIGGWLGRGWQLWLWGLAIVLDVIAALIGGQAEGWNLHPHHFAERHGLFVIIALGESLIVAAASVSGVQWTGSLLAVAVLAVAITCGLWWSYFTRTKPELDRSLRIGLEYERTRRARDVFSLLHFPMLCGVVAFAVAVEEVLTHPDDALPLAVRTVLAAGVILFVGGMAAAMWRATGRVLWPRILITAVSAIVIMFIAGIAPLVPLSVALAGILVIVLVEEWTGFPVGAEPI